MLILIDENRTNNTETKIVYVDFMSLVSRIHHAKIVYVDFISLVLQRESDFMLISTVCLT